MLLVPQGDDAIVARSKMPQIADCDIPSLLAYLGEMEISFSAGLIDPHVVKSHQAIDETKARNMPAKWLRTPILISKEPFVIDGNHRWWRHIIDGTETTFIRFEEDFQRLISLIEDFPLTTEDKS